ncbi:MAG: hypothetical protein D8B47_00735 [Kingella sp. (in: b-proteobacteria)]|jgi:hypothetical protein|nr:MAG: hypothetical protein D8B47_00735 [Kingella sp. (in: b-proteobacteria)]
MLLVIQFKRLYLQQKLRQDLLAQLTVQNLPQWQREQMQHFLHHFLILVKLIQTLKSSLHFAKLKCRLLSQP